MIAGTGFTGTDCTSVTLTSNTYSSYTYTRTDYDNIDLTIVETLNQISLRRLKELMFVPRKVRLTKRYPINKKHIKIRNQLPRKIRTKQNESNTN